MIKIMPLPIVSPGCQIDPDELLYPLGKNIEILDTYCVGPRNREKAYTFCAVLDNETQLCKIKAVVFKYIGSNESPSWEYQRTIEKISCLYSVIIANEEIGTLMVNLSEEDSREEVIKTFNFLVHLLADKEGARIVKIAADHLGVRAT